MKFEIPTSDFLDALQQVQNVVSSRASLPILSNVLIQAEGGSLKLTATDLDVGVSGSVEANISKEGATTLPVRHLTSIIRELPGETVEISVDGKNVASITCGPSFFKIMGLSEEEFPPLAAFADGNEYTIPQKMLKDSLKRTSYAISTDETRYVLNGIYMVFSTGKLSFVATDGRRLAMVENDLEFPASHETNLIVPTKAVAELKRLIGDEGDVTVRLKDNQISFEVGTSLIVSKLIDGNYPNYRQVIPGDPNETVALDREAFLRTVHRVSLLSSDKANSVKLIFTENNLDITANSPDIGEAKESIAIQYSGKDLTIAFNPEFLQAPLKNLDDDEVRIDLIDEMSPGVIRATGEFLYVIMPMRVSG